MQKEQDIQGERCQFWFGVSVYLPYQFATVIRKHYGHTSFCTHKLRIGIFGSPLHTVARPATRFPANLKCSTIGTIQ
ncbi:hypothetical protein STEG23_015495, partial [Scotinomys teguina]